ncbi:hypothetical protein ZHAS_00019877 [Anopheles sinensis]|uniref:Secreted protein n=1 Tax=Anopheles sinensis TaxID=74873 RepID=A0A084WMB4_ANOSI|nr:hypothetical protein ZHAS_00019877 [Anopheles sinensis]
MATLLTLAALGSPAGCVSGEEIGTLRFHPLTRLGEDFGSIPEQNRCEMNACNGVHDGRHRFNVAQPSTIQTNETTKTSITNDAHCGHVPGRKAGCNLRNRLFLLPPPSGK